MREYSSFFQMKTRPDGGEFVCCTDDCPENVKDLIRDIHLDCFDGCFPNDWIYKIIVEAFEDVENGEDLEDVCLEPDCYYAGLNEWFNNPFASGICNEVIEQYFLDHSLSHVTYKPLKTIHDIISYAQCRAKRMIYDAVGKFIDYEERHAD
jgi:hypothetical protein